MDSSTLPPKPASTNTSSAAHSPKQYSGQSANTISIRHFRAAQKARNILFLLIISALIGVGGFTAYKLYVNPPNKFAESINATDEIADAPPVPEAIDPNTAAQDPTAKTPGSPAANPTHSPQNSPSPNSSNSQTPTQSSSLPAGAVPVIDSIERSGIKNNPHVAIDTSSIPNGTKIRFDRNSWIAFGPENGTIRGTVTVFGKDRPGSLSLGLANGAWKVVSYSIE